MWRYPWGPHFQARLMPGDRISNLRSAGTIVPSVFRCALLMQLEQINFQSENQTPPPPLES